MTARRPFLLALTAAVLVAGVASFAGADPIPLRFVSPLVKTGAVVGCPTCSTSSGVTDPLRVNGWVPTSGTATITGDVNLDASGGPTDLVQVVNGTILVSPFMYGSATSGGELQLLSSLTAPGSFADMTDTYLRLSSQGSQTRVYLDATGVHVYTSGVEVGTFDVAGNFTEANAVTVTGSASALNFAGPTSITVHNASGGNLPAGSAVSWAGTSPDFGSVIKSGDTANPTAGIILAAIATNGYGTLITGGVATCIDSDGFLLAGDLISEAQLGSGECAFGFAGSKVVGVALENSPGGGIIHIQVRPFQSSAASTPTLTRPPAAGLVWRLDPKQITGVSDGANLGTGPTPWTITGATSATYDGTSGPKYHTTTGSINGHPSVTYQGVGGYVLTGVIGTQPVATVGNGTDIMVCMEMLSTGTATNTIFQTGFGGTYFDVTRVGTDIVFLADGGGVSITKAIPDLLQHNWCFGRHQVTATTYTYTVYLDGASSGSATGGVTGTGSFTSVYIGDGNTDEMPEFNVYVTADAQTVADVETYAHDYWGNP